MYGNNVISFTFAFEFYISTMDITTLYEIYSQHPVISTDSRNCPPGSLFFALKGDSFDGNQFAKQALQSASYAIIDDPTIQTDDRMILTDNVLKTLQKLASLHRKTLGIPVIGITGTNGKTTTKELLASVLSTTYNTLYTTGNLNNHIGVPLTLLRLTHEHEIAVIEMGANHPGEIQELAAIVQPNYGIITNVGYAHLEGFGSLEGVIRTKGELYDFLRQTDGTIFLHKENKYLQPIASGIKQIIYGKDQPAFVTGQIVDCNPYLNLQWTFQNKTYTVPTHLIGNYNLSNLLAAIAVGVFWEIPANLINQAITSYEPQNNRSQLKKTERNQLIIDAYNANPSSMNAALANFADIEASSKMVILGDMLELGTNSSSLHADVIKQLEELSFDHVILCGKQFSSLNPPFHCFETVDKLNEYLDHTQILGHYILIKGSHGIHLEKTIAYL